MRNSEIKLYFDFISQPSRAVFAFLLENEIPHEVVNVSLLQGEHLKPEFTSILGSSRLPALHHSSFKMIESHTILRYLASLPGVSAHFYPKSPQKKAKVDEYLDWHHTGLRIFSDGMLHFDFFERKLGIKFNLKPNMAIIKEKLLEGLQFIEEYFLKEEGKFINGFSSPTIADFSAYFELSTLDYLGYNFGSFPRTSKWKLRISSLPGVIEAQVEFLQMSSALNPPKPSL